MFEYLPGQTEWSDYMLRLINECQHGGGDFHECDRTFKRMRVGDIRDWHREWLRIARGVEGLGEAALARGRLVTARKAFMRAYTYYRSAEYFLPRDDSRLAVYTAGIQCFAKAGRLFSPPLERVEIPYEGATLPAYFYPAHGQPSWPTPVVLFFPGADSTKEELLFQGGDEILERGMACLMVDGPGQGESLRFKGLYARHDFEVVVRAAADHLQERPDVDPNRIGLVCISMGGYYSPRAAAFEPRVRAAIAWTGIYDVLADLYEYFPPIRPQLQWITGSKSEAEAREKLRAFTLRGVIEKVTCPLMIVHGEDDIFVPPSAAQRTYDEARCPKLLKVWQRAEGGSAHVMADNYSEALPFMFDWLAEQLGVGQAAA